jgi:ABC-2 type transport system ATP-binding protein
MQVPQGTVYGLLGRNGAGKSTTLRILMNLIRPDGGEITIWGHTPDRLSLSLRQQIGYTSDSMQLIPWLRVDQILAYNGSFYPTWDPHYVEQCLKRLELDSHKRVFSLSRGDRQKLGLLLAIGHHPRLLILDEPAGGLDPLARKEFLESLIELLHESGTTIILSSQQMTDLERIADHIGLMAHGQMRLEMPLEDLKRSYRRVFLTGSGLPPEHTLQPLTGVATHKRHPGYLELIHENWSAAAEAHLLRQFPDTRLEQSPLSLEEIFLIYADAPGGVTC